MRTFRRIAGTAIAAGALILGGCTNWLSVDNPSDGGAGNSSECAHRSRLLSEREVDAEHVAPDRRLREEIIAIVESDRIRHDLRIVALVLRPEREILAGYSDGRGDRAQRTRPLRRERVGQGQFAQPHE